MKLKVNIIGSGVGGSGIGALLQHTGKYHVKLFEKNSIIGGRLSTYEKDGFKLDVGCHLIANCEKGRLGKILNLIEKPNAIKWNYARRPSPNFHFNGQFINFPREIAKLNFKSKDLGNFMKLYSDVLKFSDEEIEKLMYVPIREFVARYTEDPKAQSMIAFFCGLYFVTTQDTSAGEFIICQKEMMRNKSSGYPIGGCIAIPKAYCDSITQDKGEVIKNNKIKRIVVEDNKAKGVELENGAFIESDIVISNGGIKATVLNMVGEKYFPKDFVEKVKNYTYSAATLQVKVALDKKITDEKMIMYLNFDDLARAAPQFGEELGIDPEILANIENIPISELMDKLSMSDIMQNDVLKNYIPKKHYAIFMPVISNLDPSTAPEGKQLIFGGSGVPANPSEGNCDYDKWADSILEGMKEVFPEIEDHMLWTEMSSPADINKFAGQGGNVIGIGQTIDQVGKNRPPMVLPIENLYVVGADTGMHGIGSELAADSALLLYQSLMKNA
ncbi:MAG: phytoene desaturase family protein [Candidatus Helarchaeota archaeon]